MLGSDLLLLARNLASAKELVIHTIDYARFRVPRVKIKNSEQSY